ncbi:MAG: hypothetical protein POELPBGB_00278 [Bacteroidia bacterium]|nr:hypothetical protein [Bacteroidia bacterium]
MKFLHFSFLILFLAGFSSALSAQQKQRSFVSKPFENKVFVEERGQFTQRAGDRNMVFAEPILYAVENPEFFAYFTQSGITFQLPEYEETEEKKNKDNGDRIEEERFELKWEAISLKFLNADAASEIRVENKVHEYYNYACFIDSAQYNFVPAYKKLVYKNLYPGVDAEFDLPEEGGIKYKFIVHPNVIVPVIVLEFAGAQNLYVDESGNLNFGNKHGKLTDHAPNAYTAASNSAIPVKYSVDGNKVKFEFEQEVVSSPEGIIIDPWITATTFPAANRAFDIQEDGAGNVIVHGSTTNYQVQKYNAAGVLQWTYVTTSTFLGDIAVDNPGNVYIIGGYPAGKRQKLDPSGVQQWSFAGLVEEWRLAFDYSKTVLTAGGYFNTTPGHNVGRFDMVSGAISNQIIYGEETRGIATDCNGDMYSLHVTFGVGTANAGTNLLRKTNANFTPGPFVQSGFLLSEAEPVGVGYAPNPTYGPNLFHGINGLVVSGPYLYIYDGASIRRFNKTTLTFLNSVAVPNGARMMCSGIAADYCGNIFAGSQNGMVMFDSLLTYQSTTPAPGIIYDIILAANGEFLVCGEGFLASVNIACTAPAALVATTNITCDGTGTVTITPTGGIGPYTYLWSPGGETTASLSNLPAGTYTYTVNDAFCRTYTGTATISANPVTTFSAASGVGNDVLVNGVCANVAAQFTDNSTTSSGNITTWNWDFGDGATDNTQNPSHAYTADGTYNVSLITITDEGCTDTTIVPVTVHPLPVADFTATDECLNAANAFTDASTVSSGIIAAWDWDFGDSNTSALQNPSNTYNADGTYTVTLNVTSDKGCYNATAFTANVVVYPLPVADFTTADFCPDVQGSFTNQSSVSSGTVNAWTWDFDDASPASNLQSPAHTYAASASYNVNLAVTTNNGCTHDTTIAVFVNPTPVAEFSATDVCVTQANQFTDLSAVANPSVITDWAWDILDNGSVEYTSQNASHTFPGDGTFNVLLSVVSTGGCTDDTLITVTVFPGAVADFTATGECLNVPTVFTDQSSVTSGTIASWAWTFGDGASDNTQSPSHTYATDGTRTVSLTVTSDNGCSSSVSFPVVVYPLPVADFSTTSVCEGLATAFSDNSSVNSGSVVSWTYDFGDNSFIASQNPQHIYVSAGSYTSQLNVVTDEGCLDSIVKTVTVHPLPVVDFEVVPGEGCMPLLVSLNDLSSIASGANAAWDWKIENLFSASQQNTNYTLENAGLYDVTLTVTSDMGCSTTLTRNDFITVHPKPFPEFAFTPTVTEILYPEITFIDLSGGSPVQWNWQFGTGDVATVQNPVYSYADTGIFTVTLEVLNQFGCSDTIEHTLVILPSFTIYVPNAFTPDGNGVNDVFLPSGIGWSDYELRIFSRWGSQVFESFDPTVGWDGTIRGKGEVAASDVYVWRIFVRDNHKRKQDFIGHVTLVR